MEEKILSIIREYYGNDEWVEENVEDLEDLAAYIARRLKDSTEE